MMRCNVTSVWSLVRPAVVLAQLVGMGALASACAPSVPDEPQSSAPAPKVAKAVESLAGVDSDVTVASANTVVNQYTTLTAAAAATATSIVVGSVDALASGPDALAPGDLVMVMQMQGANLLAAG